MVTPRDGTSTGEHDTITVDIDTTGLSTGQHSCDIHIDSNGGSGVFTVSVNIIYSGDVLDQYQEQYNGDFQVYGDQWGAQSFTPALDTLTRVELYLYQHGAPDNIVVSIRESLSGSDLVSVVKTPAEIPGSVGWVEFDFSDLTVNPDNTYYVVVHTSGVSRSNCYLWGYGSGNPYVDGLLYYSRNGGGYWIGRIYYDFCFWMYRYT